MVTPGPARKQFIVALMASTLVSLSLFLYGAWRNHSFGYGYMVWNLFLAWLPLVLALRLLTVLRQKSWSSWEGLITSFLWLLFLPNSFYMISDFIHLQDAPRVDILFDTIMLTSFIYTGVALGFSSLYLLHSQMRKRVLAREAYGYVAGILLVCSSAIYVGRDLRWNSWDIFTNPGGVLFDISDRLQHPASYPQMLVIVATFFVLLASMYGLLLQGMNWMQDSK